MRGTVGVDTNGAKLNRVEGPYSLVLAKSQTATRLWKFSAGQRDSQPSLRARKAKAVRGCRSLFTDALSATRLLRSQRS